MTTAKQIKANQANSKKSTGAKTEQGKQVVAVNAVKHGIFSSRLIMSFESADEYAELLDGLIESLNPTGSVEQLLAEKIAVAMWRQLRLTRAESASIEMNRSVYKYQVRSQVQDLVSDSYDSLSVADFEPAKEVDATQLKWCKKVLKEFESLDDEFESLDELKQAPLIMKQLETEAKQDECATAQEYIGTLSGELDEWVRELAEWCESELSNAGRKVETQKAISQALDIVQAKESAPIKNQLLIRYQVALDGELYKALEALRKQQEWRLRNSEAIEAVAV